MILSYQKWKIVFFRVSTLFSENLKSICSQSEESLQHMWKKSFNHFILFDSKWDSAWINRCFDHTRFWLWFCDHKLVHDQFRTLSKFNFWMRLSFNFLRWQKSEAKWCIKSISDSSKVILVCLCHRYIFIIYYNNSKNFSQ